MLKVCLGVIHTSLTLTDMCGYHVELLAVTSDIDMISVVFIRDKLLKLHASVSTHTTGVSPLSYCSWVISMALRLLVAMGMTAAALDILFGSLLLAWFHISESVLHISEGFPDPPNLVIEELVYY